MTEELSQDSSRPQETSQDSGVSSEGQLSNPTGENTAAQNSQKSQVVTKHNNQNNKKYDLGVLFVHGIGSQQKGDTFEEMYIPIKNEFNEDKNFLFVELEGDDTVAKCPIIDKRPLGGNGRIDVIFRESHWNGVGSKSTNNAPQNSKSKLCNFFKGVIRDFLGFIKSIIYLLYFLASGIFYSRIRFLISLLLFYAIVILVVFPNNLIEAKGWAPWIVIGGFVVCMLYPPVSAAVFHMLKGLCSLVKNPVHAIKQLFKQPRRSSERKVPFKTLYQQINDMVMYGHHQSGGMYINRVKEDILNLLGESQKILVVAHSMGGLLSYEALKSIESNYPGRIKFYGVGSGLGPVTVLRQGSFNRVSQFFINLLPRNNSRFFLVWLLLLIRALVLYYIIFVFIYSVLDIMLSMIFFIADPNSAFNSDIVDQVLIVAFLIIIKIIRLSVLAVGSMDGIQWKEYTHILDPVGDMVTNAYGKNVFLYRFLLPGNFSWPHVIPSYFEKNSILVKHIRDEIISESPVSQVDGDNIKKYGPIFSCASVVLSAAFMVWMHLGYREFNLLYYFMTLLVSVAIYVFFDFVIIPHFATWNGYATWGESRAKNGHIYMLISSLGCLYSLVGSYILDALFVLKYIQ